MLELWNNQRYSFLKGYLHKQHDIDKVSSQNQFYFSKQSKFLMLFLMAIRDNPKADFFSKTKFIVSQRILFAYA